MADALGRKGLLPGRLYEEIVRRLGGEPNRADWACSRVDVVGSTAAYRNSRPLLSRLSTTGPAVLGGARENAGVVDLGEGASGLLQIGEP